jgi:hypothetical protein
LTNKGLATLLRSAASALEHGRQATVNKKLAAILAEVSATSATGPVIVVEGGIVQDVFALDASQPNGYRDLAHTLVDYDIFEGDPAEDIAARWNGFPGELQAYFAKHLPREYGMFQEAVKEAQASK